MAYEGWFSIDGTEVVNAERVRRYMKEMVPTIQMPTKTCECPELAPLLDDSPYSTPLNDNAPWVDLDNPDTWRFAGVFPLEITSLDDSTRTAEVIEYSGSGGSFTGIRNTTREIRLSALAMAADDAALSAGLSWLRNATTGLCVPGCETGTACFLSACPDIADAQIGPYVEDPISLSLLDPQGSATFIGGVFTNKGALYQTNYVRNPSAEVDLSGWTPAFTGATLTRDATHVGDGAWAVKGAWVSGNLGAAYVWADGLTAGQTYSFTVKAYVPTGSTHMRADVFFVTVTGATQTSTFNSLTTLTGTFVATASSHAVGAVTVSTVGGAGQMGWVDSVCVVDGPTPPTYFDGDTADVDPYSYEWTGTAGLSTSQKILATGADGLRTPTIVGDSLSCDEMSWKWLVKGDVGAIVRLTAVGEFGTVQTALFEMDGTSQLITIGDSGRPEQWVYAELTVESGGTECAADCAGFYDGTAILTTADFDTAGSAYGLTSADFGNAGIRAVTVESVTLRHRSRIDPADCATPYLRTLHDFTIISGPQVTQRFNTSSGAMAQIEMIGVAGVPWLYGQHQEIGRITGTEGFVVAQGASAAFGLVPPPPCDAPHLPSFVQDPDCAPVATPPTYAMPPQLCIADADYKDTYTIGIPDDLIPQWQSAVAILRISTGDQAARGLRVRFLPRPLPNQQPYDLDPCSGCGSFLISYIPASSTMVLDGTTERANLELPGDQTSRAGHLLFGLNEDSLFSWPEMSCGMGYYLVVEAPAGLVTEVSLSVALRE